MTLKIKPEDMRVLRERVEARVKATPHWVELYKSAGLSHTRYRWDILWSSKLKIGSSTAPGDLNLYDYLDDTHIDSALIAILGRDYPQTT